MNEYEIFAAAIKLSGDQRIAFLDAACGQETPLRQQVDALLVAQDESGDPLTRQDDRESDATRTHDTLTKSGSVIGPYKLLEEIGEGGMGSVWVAEQSKPIKRRVAIKLIKAGMDSKAVLARFGAERQALAMMDHPNIARVLDGGMTELGRPYFAMEYVKGVPLTEYCDEAKLSVKERLKLFLPICKAVQHAHQKGIIHRDLKPTNILVCLYDGKPVPKVIDFGLAKAMHQSLTEQTLFTAHGMMVGTPRYMSPEQAEHNNLDIDTRTDVYSLGVILYELLTGGTPLEKAQMKQAAGDEILRLLKDIVPPKPSTRLSGSASLPSVAAQRSIDPVHLTRSLTGDLDWVVMKALEKERSRRYETANGLAEDIRRHLSDEPVSASPPSTGYRMQKFIKRNRMGVIAASAVAVALLLGVAGTTGGMFWALAERKDAVAAREAESEAKQEALANAEQAQLEATRATAAEHQTAETLVQVAAERDAKELARKDAEDISTFLGNVFKSPDPTSDGREIKVVELLDTAAKELETNLVAQPVQRANLQATLGRTYHALGLYHQAIKLQETARDYHLGTSGPEHPDTLRVMNSLASSYYRAGRRDEALPLLEKVLTLCRKVLDPEHPDTLDAMNNLASCYHAAGRWDEALPLRNEVLTIRRKVLGPEHPATLRAMNNLAISYHAAGRRYEALPLREEVLTLSRKVLGPEHAATLRAMNNMAISYHAAGRRYEALPLREEVLTLSRKVLGPVHPGTLMAMHNLAISYHAAGRGDEALPLREEVLTLSRQVLGTEHPDTPKAMRNLASSYDDAGRLDEALKLREEVLALRPNDAGTHNEFAWRLATIPDSHGEYPNSQQAVVWARRAHELDPNNGNVLNTLGVALYRAEQWQEAIDTLQKSTQRGVDEPYNWLFIAMSHWKLDQQDKARPWYDKSLAWQSDNEAAFKRDIELQSFFAEAAALPGAGVAAETTPKQKPPDDRTPSDDKTPPDGAPENPTSDNPNSESDIRESTITDLSWLTAYPEGINNSPATVIQ